MTRSRWLGWLAWALAFGTAAAAGAESSLRLAYPDVFAQIPAATYDADGERIGAARVVIEERVDGRVHMSTETGFDDGPRTLVKAEMIRVGDGASLQLVWQESRTVDGKGVPLGLLRVDHEGGHALCIPGPELDPAQGERIELPALDRIANVPLNLLFLPLVSGQQEEVDFQFFLCGGGGPRLLDFRARVAGRRNGGPDDRHLVEIRYEPDLGMVGSALASLVLPRLSMWFDPQARQPWLAHRIPLYSGGPEVLVVRDGVPPAWLDEEL